MLKKFSETKVGKFLLDKGSNLFNVVGDVLPNNGVLGVVKNLIEKDDTIPQQDKDIALLVPLVGNNPLSKVILLQETEAL